MAWYFGLGLQPELSSSYPLVDVGVSTPEREMTMGDQSGITISGTGALISGEALLPGLEKLFEITAQKARNESDDRQARVIAEIILDAVIKMEIAESDPDDRSVLYDDDGVALLKAKTARKLMGLLPSEKQNVDDPASQLSATRHLLLSTLLAAMSGKMDGMWIGQVATKVLDLPTPGPFTANSFETLVREYLVKLDRAHLLRLLDLARTSHNEIVIRKTLQTLVGKKYTPIDEVLRAAKELNTEIPF